VNRGLTLVVAALGCVVVVAAGTGPPPLRILLVGNSLTSANGLPAMLERLGSLNGTPLVTNTVAAPNFSLEDHWQSGEARRLLRGGGWTVVVLQQGPSALPESRVSLREFTRRFGEEIHEAGARPALYMVWPAKGRLGDFDRVSESYRLAAADVHGILLAAGDAWREAWKRDPALPLYAADEFHPSSLGSYLAALVIYQGLSGRAPSAHVPLDGREIDSTRLRLLNASVQQALRQH
jgi:hypothetical protein